MFSKRRKMQEEAVEAEVVSRELGWLEAISRYKTEITFGAPMRCPSFECGDFGLVETIAAGRQHNRCWSCGTEWTISRRSLRLFALALADPQPTTIVGDGTLVAELDAPDAARTTRERFVGVRNVLAPDPGAGGGPLTFPA